MTLTHLLQRFLQRSRSAGSRTKTDPLTTAHNGYSSRALTMTVLTVFTLLSPKTDAAVHPCITIDCPSDITVECTSPVGTAVTFRPTALSNCGQKIALQSTPSSGSFFPLGTNKVICVASDALGQKAECSFRVIVTDHTAPTLQVPTNIIAHCTSENGAKVDFSVSATDNADATPQIVCLPPSGTFFPIGTTEVKCIAADDRGNRVTKYFNVVVEGTCGSQCVDITCPHDVVLPVIQGTNRIVNFFVTGTNQCERLPVTVVCSPPSGSAFKLGVTTVYCEASDGYESKKCSFKVTIQDTTPPRLQVPSQVLAQCQGWDPASGRMGSTVNYSVIANDNTGLKPSVVCTPPSGSFFHLGTNPVVCVATDSARNKATNRFLVIVKSGPKCEVDPTPITELSPDNWSFELGLVSWVATGTAFENQPARANTTQTYRITDVTTQMRDRIGGDYWQRLTYPIGIRGRFGISTADNRPFEQGELFDLTVTYDETVVGELLSKPFMIEKDYISFLIGGTQDSDHLRVELLTEVAAGTPDSIKLGVRNYKVDIFSYAHGREEMRRVGWSMNGFGHHNLGKWARIRIIDGSPRGHINVDDFQFMDTHPDFQKVQIGDHEFPAVLNYGGDKYDWDAPVWGFADLHTHPMSYLGFKEGVMHGHPDGGPNDPTNPEHALGVCRCLHNGAFPDNLCGNFLRMALEIGTDGDGNNPHGEGWDVSEAGNNPYAQFRRWPVFSTTTHQQMWYDWIKRAYDGGLRTMIALCVNNPLLGSASEGPGPEDDVQVGDSQIKEMIAFAQRHSDFMEIAYDPVQMRDIVRRNKLAVIIGSELDDIGNFARNNAISDLVPSAGDRSKVRAEIKRLHNLGLRYIFPVHLMDNKFGGTPVANILLNVASRYLNGEAMKVEAADKNDEINYWFPENFDLSQVIEDHKPEIILGASLAAVAAPLLPLLIDGTGLVPPGSGTAVGAGLLPIALVAGIGALPGTLQAIPPNVWPINHHYPPYPTKGDAPFGHRNKRGLTPVGEFALMEMMRLGMMIDVDHMSQKTLRKVFTIAENNPVGYPLNSGHNSFRALAMGESSENNRSDEQMVHIRDLGGMFGVGWENSATYPASTEYSEPLTYTTSVVHNDNHGTSKSVAQTYIYALESMSGRNVALGTDINGLIKAPGPRFGANASFSSTEWGRAGGGHNQDNGVLYSPKHGRPIVGPAFVGAATDPEKLWGFPLGEHLDGNNNMKPGYAYTKAQVNFFPAIRILYYLKDWVDSGKSQQQIMTELTKITQAQTSEVPAGDVFPYALGLLNGIKNWSLTSNDPYERFGKLIYQVEVLHIDVPSDIENNAILNEMFLSLRSVWSEYHQTFGYNTPLKRYRMGAKDWDINFEGVAHYGLLPDFLQDLKNVGLETSDMNPLFRSADNFADMWVKTLRAAHEISRPTIHFSETRNNLYDHLNLDWVGQEDDILEQTDSMSANPVWVSAKVIGETVAFGKVNVKIEIDHKVPHRYFRVRKPN